MAILYTLLMVHRIDISSKGGTIIFEFSDLDGVLIRKYDVRLLASHSFEEVVTTYALYTNPDIQIDKYVLIATSDKFTERKV